MNEQKKQAVIDKIHELVPSTMELSFGCRVEDDRFGKGIGIILRSYPEEGTHEVAWANLTTELSPRNPFWKILGHRIQLHHVLQAMQSVEIKDGLFWGIDYNGYFTKLYGAAWSEDYLKKDFAISTPSNGMWSEVEGEPKWDLTKPLSDQLDPVWELLYNVLIKE